MAFLRCSILKEVLSVYAFVSGFDSGGGWNPGKEFSFGHMTLLSWLREGLAEPPHNEQYWPTGHLSLHWSGSVSLWRSNSTPETYYYVFKCCTTHCYRWHSLIRILRMYIVILLWELVLNFTWYLFPSLIPWILKDLLSHTVQALSLDLLQVSFLLEPHSDCHATC